MNTSQAIISSLIRECVTARGPENRSDKRKSVPVSSSSSLFFELSPVTVNLNSHGRRAGESENGFDWPSLLRFPERPFDSSSLEAMLELTGKVERERERERENILRVSIIKHFGQNEVK